MRLFVHEMYQSNPRPEATTELMKSCVTLYKELLLLENFAVMNFCGISKVMSASNALQSFHLSAYQSSALCARIVDSEEA